MKSMTLINDEIFETELKTDVKGAIELTNWLIKEIQPTLKELDVKNKDSVEHIITIYKTYLKKLFQYQEHTENLVTYADVRVYKTIRIEHRVLTRKPNTIVLSQLLKMQEVFIKYNILTKIDFIRSFD